MRLKTKKTLNTQLYLMECFAVSKKVVNFALCLEIGIKNEYKKEDRNVENLSDYGKKSPDR